MALRHQIIPAFVFLLCFCYRGESQPCTTASIKVTQTKTAARASGCPIYKVVITNCCICSQTAVLLSCPGFATTLSVDPTVFRPLPPEEASGATGLCVVNDFLPVFSGYPVKFLYSKASPVPLSVHSSQVNCS
ncbi:unnamed protein product [Spirodela intermedia]|uniref:Uncharacterized protein n=2 Tax=Spirodela intermedia TaxID=51605 RepID=A0A7I8JAL0_SPIIN|nr:unnamed protein product [Spirodela intermedia]CAA6667149.1 unnamed protein product [Spirodela intermedia]CAA7403970.1 unnamed protein product [Spirodela intermedia]